MNLLLHGLEAPAIEYGNSLTVKITELGAKDRVDVIMTNPPFGGEEEVGIRNNFPADKQTSETALLFLQLIMRKLRKPSGNNTIGGRAAVVVPNGTLYQSGVASRIREELITKFALDLVVRLPKGVFEPYADIPTNILFFSAGTPKDSVWFYEHPLPAARAHLKAPSYSKSDPLEFSEFDSFFTWWSKKKENRQAWKVDVKALGSQSWNLDQRNPRSNEISLVSPSALAHTTLTTANGIVQRSRSLAKCFETLEAAFQKLETGKVTTTTLGQACSISKGRFPTKKTLPGNYRFYVLAADERTANEYQFDGEAVIVPTISSTGHGHAAINRIYYATGKFAVANILAYATVKSGVQLLTRYLYYYLYRFKDEKLVSLMAGTANTSLTVEKLEMVEISFPDIDTQKEVVRYLDAAMLACEQLRDDLVTLVNLVESASEDMVQYVVRGS
jgi:hypothetical protein